MSLGYTIVMVMNGKAFNAMPAYLKKITAVLAERIVVVTNGPTERKTERLKNLDMYITEKAPEDDHFRLTVKLGVTRWQDFYKWYDDFFGRVHNSKNAMEVEYLAVADAWGVSPSHWSNLPKEKQVLSIEKHVYVDHMDINEL